VPFSNGEVGVQQFQIDTDHSNSFTAWKNMDSPEKPTAEQYAELEKAGQLAAISGVKNIDLKDGKATMKIQLPRQAVSLVVLQGQPKAN
jgi:xylan 1,4-beta-xylosidase